MGHYYIILTPEFCAEHAEYSNGVDKFGFSVTTDGRYVTSANSLNVFPELFQTEVTTVKLSITDFPPTIDE